MLPLTSRVETNPEINFETLVSAQEYPFSTQVYDGCLPSSHCRSAPSLAYRILCMRIALRQSFASNFRGM